MANTCDTQYKITGERKAVADLWNTINGLNVNQKNVWLGDVAKHYDIDYEQKDISVRGHIYWAEYEENEEIALLSLDTETAWTACNDFFKELNKRLDGRLSISYREIEWGCDIFYVHDEGFYFTEECCVDANGKPFGEIYQELYDTVADAIEVWCEKTGIKRGERSDEEMLEYIAQFEYEDEETFFFINKFEFE